jgi:pimeloyl-ACP methyl ester carboxylesterase
MARRAIITRRRPRLDENPDSGRRRRRLSGCGHALHIQDGDRFNRMVIDFLGSRML